MDLKEKGKSLGKILAVGAIWVYILSIPYNGRLLFDHAYDVLVDNSVVHSITREAKVAMSDAKKKARSALEEGETEVARTKAEVEEVSEF